MSDAPEHIGPYEIEERLARGPLGRLYRAKEASTGRRVALKVMPAKLAADEGAVKRFLTDAEAIAKIDHPNVARILDFGQDGENVYYAVQFGSEIPLGQLLKQRRLTLQEAFTVFKGVALGLEAAHARGVLHRDLHPANVLVSDDLATVRLTDFGLSSAADQVTADGTATSMSTRALHYLAPEQIGSGAQPDERSDIYSLGVLLYEMLTGRVPIGQFNLPSRINAELPAELDHMVLKCIDREPSARYPSVSSLLREIERMEDRLRLKLVSELAGIGRTFGRPTSQIFKHRKAVGATALVLGMVAALGFGARYWTSREPARPAQSAAPEDEEAVVESAMAEATEGEEPPEGIEAPGAVAEPGSTAEGGGKTTAAEAATKAPATTPSKGAAEEATAGPETVETTEATRPAAETPTAASTPSAQAAAARLLGAAQASAGAGRLDDALRETETLVDRYPGTSAATEALFLRATIQETRKRYDEAMNTYTQIGTLESDPELRAKARYRFGRAALDSNLPDRNVLALGAFDEIPRAFPRTGYAPLALASKAAIEEAEKTEFDSKEFGHKVPGAFLTSLRIVEGYPDSVAAERAFWVVGEQFEDLKLWERAADAYSQLGRRFPETKLDAWWKAGQILDRRLDDTDRAIDAYRRVPDASPHAEDARKRVAKLSK